MTEQTQAEIETALCGKRIVAIRKMTTKELEAEGWDEPRALTAEGMAIVLDDGTIIYASQDDEGNGPGALFANKGKKYFAMGGQK